jgi:hypothetical protein
MNPNIHSNAEMINALLRYVKKAEFIQGFVFKILF